MSLDPLGVIYAVQIAIYVPIVFFALRICSRYGVRERGWLLLLIFSLIRIVGSALLVAVEQQVLLWGRYYYSNDDTTWAGKILEASGMSFLLLSTLGLIEIITEGPSGERKHWHTIVFRVLHFVGIVGLVLTIIGMSPIPWKDSSDVTMEIEIGASLLAGLFIVLVAVTVLQWASRYQPMKYRKQLLVAVTVALPFLAVRTLYSVLSSFSYTDYIGFDPNNPGPLAKFNPYNLQAEWQTYVSMALVMEYAVVVIYASTGTVLRLDEDYVIQESD